jgi:hypothetical protein
VKRAGRERVGSAAARRVPQAVWVAVAVAGACLPPSAAFGEISSVELWVSAAATPTRVASVDGLAPLGSVRDPAPEPGLGPDAVVGIVLHALQHNDDPVADHGIAVTFAFTSPENRDVTGPIDRFRALVKSSAYRPIIGHTRADRGPLQVVAQHAREQVAITGAHGERAVYLFLRSRQEAGAYKGCWMADGVLREHGTAQTPVPLLMTVVSRRY